MESHDNPQRKDDLCEVSSPHDRLPSLVCVVELLVPVGEEGVALAYGFTDECRVFGTKQPGLTPRCIQVGVCPKERLIRPRLIPSDQQLRARSLKEAAHIRWNIHEPRVTIHSGFLYSD